MSSYLAINLYKRNIPFTGEELAQHQYYTFGYFDALDILPEQNSLMKLWEYYIEFERNTRLEYTQNRRQFSSQPLFLSREGAWEKKINDDFADKDLYSQYPFIFIALLNREKNPESGLVAEQLIAGTWTDKKGASPDWLQWINEVCDCIIKEEGNKEKRDFRFTCYYPLNISQGVLRIHAKSYMCIVNLLAAIQRKYGVVQYSYTISGLNYLYITDDTLKLESKDKLNVSFDIIVNQVDSFYSFTKNLDELLTGQDKETNHSELIGSTDVRLSYQSIPAEQLIQAYRQVIKPTNKDYKMGASSFLSDWCSPIYKTEQSGRIRNDGESWFCDKITYGNLMKNERALFKLLDTAVILNNSPYMHYINSIIKPAILILINNLEVIGRISDTELDEKTILDFNEDLNSFLQHCQDLLSSTARTDRQFFEAPGFNMILDETPIKLVAAYHSCLYEVRCAMKEDKFKEKKYAFLIYPKMTQTMTCQPLFLEQDKKSRLFCISLPWDDVFNIRRVLAHLIHETGHSISTTTKNRKNRYDSLIQLVSRFLVYSIYKDMFFDINRLEDLFAKRYEEEIKQIIESVTTEEEEEEDAMYYSHRLTNSLGQAAVIVLQDINFHQRLWFDYVQSRNYESKIRNSGFLKPEEWDELVEYNTISSINRMHVMSDFTFDGFGINRIVEYSLTIAKECFSDLLMIAVLKMDWDDYLLTIFDAGYKDEGSLEDVDLYTRICTIGRVMNGKWMCQGEKRRCFNSEDQFLIKFKERLKEDKQPWLTEILKKTIDHYLNDCIVELNKQFTSKTMLLTRALYQCAAFYLKNGKADQQNSDEGIIPAIQNLLWSIGREI